MTFEFAWAFLSVMFIGGLGAIIGTELGSAEWEDEQDGQF